MGFSAGKHRGNCRRVLRSKVIASDSGQVRWRGRGWGAKVAFGRGGYNITLAELGGMIMAVMAVIAVMGVGRAKRWQFQVKRWKGSGVLKPR